MRGVVAVVLAALVTGCGATDMQPTPIVETLVGVPAAAPSPDAPPAPPVPSFIEVLGPSGCLSADAPATLEWTVHVRNNPRTIKTIRALAFHSPKTLSCTDIVTSHGRRMTKVSGPLTYDIGASSITVFATASDYDGKRCGTRQFDIATDDGAGGYHTVHGVVLVFGADCPEEVTPTPPTTPTTPQLPLSPTPPVPPLVPSCPPPRDTMVSDGSSDGVTWERNGLEPAIRASFTIRPDLVGPVNLAFATFTVPAHATQVFPNMAPVPQTLTWASSGLYSPGIRYTVAFVLPASPHVQVDIFGCDAEKRASESLTAANFWYWVGRWVSSPPERLAGWQGWMGRR